MNKKTLLILLSLFIICGPAYAGSGRNILFQVSTMPALMSGAYEGLTTVNSLKLKGDFGIGAFEGLDGEMIMIDGQMFKSGPDLRCSPVINDEKLPFATATFFEPHKVYKVYKDLNYNELVEYLNGILPNKKYITAIKIKGAFEYIKIRSVLKQKTPYPKLSDALKTQATLSIRNADGVAVGFWFPEYLNAINNAGYHFHFITAERDLSGHLLDLRIRNVSIELDDISQLQMILPK